MRPWSGKRPADRDRREIEAHYARLSQTPGVGMPYRAQTTASCIFCRCAASAALLSSASDSKAVTCARESRRLSRGSRGRGRARAPARAGEEDTRARAAGGRRLPWHCFRSAPVMFRFRSASSCFSSRTLSGDATSSTRSAAAFRLPEERGRGVGVRSRAALGGGRAVGRGRRSAAPGALGSRRRAGVQPGECSRPALRTPPPLARARAPHAAGPPPSASGRRPPSRHARCRRARAQI